MYDSLLSSLIRSVQPYSLLIYHYDVFVVHICIITFVYQRCNISIFLAFIFVRCTTSILYIYEPDQMTTKNMIDLVFVIFTA